MYFSLPHTTLFLLLLFIVLVDCKRQNGMSYVRL